MRIVTPALLLLVATISGCYRYVPTARSSLAPGAPVMIALTLLGSVNTAQRIGNNVAAVEGTVSDIDSAGVTVSLLSVRRRGENLASTWSGELLRLSSEDILEIRSKELSRGRTAVAWTAFAAGSAGLVVAIAKATGLVGGSSGGRPIPTP